MNVSQEELDDWARACEFANAYLLHALAMLRSGEAEGMAQAIEAPRQHVWQLRRALIRYGAHPPARPPRVPDLTPLHLLDTPANRRYAARLRDAIEALQEVQRERELEDGGAIEILREWLAEAEDEIYGPEGRGEGPG